MEITETITAENILGCMNSPEDIVNLRVFADRKGEDSCFAGKKYSVPEARLATIEGELAEQNRHNRGVFFVVNHGGHTDPEIDRINAQFVEMDSGSFEDQQRRIDEFALKPSVIIRTKKSYHVYWLIKNGDVSRFRAIQKGLVRQFDGDPACVNESRVMRLPGYYHCKSEPVLVTCICFHPERRYSQEQLAELLPELDGAKPGRTETGAEKGIELVAHECSFINHCREQAETLPEPLWQAMITNLAVFEGGRALIHEYSRPYPGYSERQTDEKLRRFMKSGTGPVTCEVIEQRGYKCPKRLSGACSCRAPAALCYKPLEIDSVRQLVSHLPVKHTSAEDMQTASEFIRKYLYNCQRSTAYAIIQDDIKAHFGFKTSSVKLLEAEFRSVSDEHSKGLKTRRGRTEGTIPPWYSASDKGLKFHPGVLAGYLAENEAVIYSAAQFYLYSGGVYSAVDDDEVEAICQRKMLISEAKMSQIKDTADQWRLQVRAPVQALNPNPYLINLKNGLYDVLENALLPHDREYLSTVQLQVSYMPGARCPLFMKFLNDALGGDSEQIAIIQEMLGYFLVPLNSAQKCFVIVGAAGAGKSLLLRVVSDILLGAENVSNVSWQALNERFKTAELFGRLANVFADLPTKNIDDNGIFKALVGEDYLTVERKNKDPFSFQSTARLLFSCNSIPRNYGDRSEGFYRRLIIIRFDRPVPECERDASLFEKLSAEGDGIFLFALEGLKRLMANGFRFSVTEKNIKELQEYREDSDSVLAFVRDCCEKGPEYQVASSELFNSYKNYCQENGLKAYSQRSFVMQIKTVAGVAGDRDNISKRRMLIGLRLLEDVA